MTVFCLSLKYYVRIFIVCKTIRPLINPNGEYVVHFFSLGDLLLIPLYAIEGIIRMDNGFFLIRPVSILE